MQSTPFTRPTLIAAVELLGQLSQAGFNQVVLRLGVENEIPFDTSISVAKKCNLLTTTVVRKNAVDIETLDGNMTLGEAVVREAAHLAQRNSGDPLQTTYARALARDGYVLTWDGNDQNPSLRVALPETLQLPQTDEEVHELLKRFDFATPLGHLDQAIDAHTRGNWAAANGQLRSFLESLFNEAANKVAPQKAASRSNLESRLALLADHGFLATDRNEWTADGKNYINGLFKMLHTEGSHPGLSDEDHCTFRLHVVLVTARMLLRRLCHRCASSSPLS